MSVIRKKFIGQLQLYGNLPYKCSIQKKRQIQLFVRDRMNSIYPMNLFRMTDTTDTTDTMIWKPGFTLLVTKKMHVNFSHKTATSSLFPFWDLNFVAIVTEVRPPTFLNFELVSECWSCDKECLTLTLVKDVDVIPKFFAFLFYFNVNLSFLVALGSNSCIVNCIQRTMLWNIASLSLNMPFHYHLWISKCP